MDRVPTRSYDGMMAILEKLGRLARLSFYLGLGGMAALASACGSSGRRVGTPGGSSGEDAGTAATPPDASVEIAEDPGSEPRDEPVREADTVDDAEETAGSDPELWNVIYE